MGSEQVYDVILRAVERYGFGLILATAVLWFVRVDLVLPMVEAHKQFLQELSASQREIAGAMQEQTRLLYAVQAQVAKDKSYIPN